MVNVTGTRRYTDKYGLTHPVVVTGLGTRANNWLYVSAPDGQLGT